jgi:hypothetical protein
MVIYHSIVLQYFDAAARRDFAAMIEAAGAEATAERPLAWLSFEAASSGDQFELTLTYWPGGGGRASPPPGSWAWISGSDRRISSLPLFPSPPRRVRVRGPSHDIGLHAA